MFVAGNLVLRRYYWWWLKIVLIETRKRIWVIKKDGNKKGFNFGSGVYVKEKFRITFCSSCRSGFS